jgi:hypothetical protein
LKVYPLSTLETSDIQGLNRPSPQLPTVGKFPTPTRTLRLNALFSAHSEHPLSQIGVIEQGRSRAYHNPGPKFALRKISGELQSSVAQRYIYFLISSLYLLQLYQQDAGLSNRRSFPADSSNCTAPRQFREPLAAESNWSFGAQWRTHICCSLRADEAARQHWCVMPIP